MASFASVCLTPGCSKEAKLACPTCVKQGLPPSKFCDQECFKKSWDEHKKLHKPAEKKKTAATTGPSDPLSKMPAEFGFNVYTGMPYLGFTGKLRPWQQSPTRKVPDHIPRPDYATHPQGIPLSEVEDKRTNTSIKVYSKEEIAGIREACRIGREVLDLAGAAVKVGVTCDELDRIVHEATVVREAYPSPLNYHNFPKSVCTSVNEVICHGIPDYRPLQDGDIVNIDVSVFYKGYHGDLNETFLVGNVDSQSVGLVKCAFDALTAAVATVRPGALYRDIGAEISKVTTEARCSIVKTYCGHGIGTLFHTSPNVPHYASNKAKGTMEVGHIFTIEPMINLGTYNDILWPDNWTAVTSDGQRSAQFEHTMVVTETGCELLTVRVGAPLDRLLWSIVDFQR